MNLLSLSVLLAAQQPTVIPKQMISLPDILDAAGRAAEIPAKGAKLTIVIFVSTDCPIANRMAPEMTRVFNEFREKGVAARLIYPDTSTKPADILQHLKEYNLPVQGVLDNKRVVTKAFGAVVTPQAFVVNAKGKIIYVGRINNLYDDHGQIRQKPTRADLKIALQEALAGRPISQPVTQSLGCFLPPP